MSYVVLARKYRSRNFSEMVGQEHVVQALRNALDQQRLHHAYLFTGTRGVGKTTVSRILAKSLNCVGSDGQGGITAHPCGVCQSCRDIDAGRFVDYTELDAASNRGVEEVQGLLEQAAYKPVQGRFKVFMIDEVHMLSGHAFNAMLKTLEEPPEYLKFVLATTDPQKVPVTVLSRCLQFNLRPMAPEVVQAHLGHVLAQERVDADPAALALIARAARGSMRDALSLTDQAIAFGAGVVREPEVREMLGVVGRGQVLALAAALAQRDGAKLVDLSDRMRDEGLSAGAALEDLAAVLQRLAVLQVTRSTPSEPDGAVLVEMADAFRADELQLAYSMALHGRAELGLAPDEHAALCMVLLRILAFLPTAEKKSPAPRPARLTAETSVASRAPVEQSRQPPWAAPPPARTPAASLPPGDRLPVRNPVAPPAGGESKPAEPKPVPIDEAVVEVPVRSATQGPADRERPDAQVRFNPTPEGDFWTALVLDLIGREAINALPRELALQSQLVGRDEQQWLLRVESETLNQEGSRERLHTALRAAGHEVSLAIEVGVVSDSPAKRLAARAAQRQEEAQTIIMQDPFVQQMMREFGARIVPGSLKPI